VLAVPAASPAAFPKKSNYSMRAQCRMSFPRRKHVAPLPQQRGRTEVVVHMATCESVTAAAGRPEQEEVASRIRQNKSISLKVHGKSRDGSSDQPYLKSGKNICLTGTPLLPDAD